MSGECENCGEHTLDCTCLIYKDIANNTIYDDITNVPLFIDSCVAVVGLDKTLKIFEHYKNMEDQIEAGVLQDYYTNKKDICQ